MRLRLEACCRLHNAYNQVVVVSQNVPHSHVPMWCGARAVFGSTLKEQNLSVAVARARLCKASLRSLVKTPMENVDARFDTKELDAECAHCTTAAACALAPAPTGTILPGQCDAAVGAATRTSMRGGGVDTHTGRAHRVCDTCACPPARREWFRSPASNHQPQAARRRAGQSANTRPT